MDVKLVARTLDLFELFAAEQRPLPLTELARLLNVPVSSCLALARTLVSRGFKRVRPLHGGIDAWVARGYGVEHVVPVSPATLQAAEARA